MIPVTSDSKEITDTDVENVVRSALTKSMTDHGIGNIGLEQGFFHCPGLSIGPVKNCKIFMTESLSAQLVNSSGDKESLFLFVISPIVDNLFTAFVFSPEIFRTAVTASKIGRASCRERV